MSAHHQLLQYVKGSVTTIAHAHGDDLVQALQAARRHHDVIGKELDEAIAAAWADPNSCHASQQTSWLEAS